MLILSFCSKINFIGQETLWCSEKLRELMEKLPDWGMRQILHPLCVFTYRYIQFGCSFVYNYVRLILRRANSGKARPAKCKLIFDTEGVLNENPKR